MLPVILFIVGMIVLLLATEQLIKLTTRLAHTLRLSPLIVGITVVAIGTSLPELVVSSIASAENDYGLAVGNVLGSNIINILLVLGIGIITGKIQVGTTKTQKNVYILTFVSIMYLASFWLHLPGFIIASIFLGLAILFTVTQYRWGVAGRDLEDKIMLKLSYEKSLTLPECALLLIFLLCVFAGGSIIVTSVKQIALITGYSTNILGLSITSIATSLPEIIATLIGIRHKKDKLLLGNIIGSNIYNILLIGGVSNFWMKQYRVPIFETGFFIISTLIFLGIIIAYKGKAISKWVGYGLFAVTLCYFLGMYYQ